MPVDTVLEMISLAVKTALLVAAPMLLTGLVVGVAISLFQAVTQIQEMTLTFIPKILAVFFVLVLSLPWMLNTLIEYTKGIFANIANIAGS